MNKEKTAIFHVYILPLENYCGCTGRGIDVRLKEHAKLGRNIKWAKIIRSFSNEKEALEYETYIQLKYNYKGYRYNDSWRDIQKLKIKETGEKHLYSKTRKQVICVNTGIVFKGVRHCERFFNVMSGNLSKHLHGVKHYRTFAGYIFNFLNTEIPENLWEEVEDGVKIYNPNNIDIKLFKNKKIKNNKYYQSKYGKEK